MSQMQFHDIYNEASSRRHREAEEWVRRRSLHRDAKSARSRLAERASNRRVRLVTVLSPMVALAALALTGVIG